MAAKTSRALGEDVIPGEVMKLDPQLFAQLLHPLWLKNTLRLEEPLSWRGGQVKDLYKNIPSPAVAHRVCEFGATKGV